MIVWLFLFSPQKKIGDLEDQIRKAQIRVLEQKKKMGGVNASKENDAMIGKQIRTLESRLDKALVRFNEALAENKTMREKIDHLRVDRVVFDNVYKRLERSLHEKKKEMIAIIEDSKVGLVCWTKAKNETPLSLKKCVIGNEVIELAYRSPWSNKIYV